MIRLVVATLMAFGMVQAKAESLTSLETVQRAADEKVEMLLKEIKRLKSSDEGQSVYGESEFLGAMNRAGFGILHDPNCDDDDEATCAVNCTSRWGDGSCKEYGADYCGPNASCAVRCASRWSDGSCKEYGSDYCGSDASCMINCTSRWGDGSCKEYGGDICY